MDNKKRLNGKYIFKDDHKEEYVNGAIGGMNARGEVIVDFFFERNARPEEYVIDIDGIQTKESFSYEDFIRREIKSSIVMRLEDARMIYEWLGHVIQSAKKTDSVSKS